MKFQILIDPAGIRCMFPLSQVTGAFWFRRDV
jgi:hypothetical protein